MQRRWMWLVLSLVAAGLGAAGCGDDPDTARTGGGASAPPAASTPATEPAPGTTGGLTVPIHEHSGPLLGSVDPLTEVGRFDIFEVEHHPEGVQFADGSAISGEALVLNMGVTDLDYLGVFPDVVLGTDPQPCAGDCPEGMVRLSGLIRPSFTINTDGNQCGSQPEKTECNVVFELTGQAVEDLRLVPFGQGYAPERLIFRLPAE